MTILALEFSSERRSVALARDGIVLSEAVEQTGGRTTNALGLIEKALAEAGVDRAEIEVIVVGLGPGSYTGIRAAIAVAHGWQLALGVKLVGVSSAEAIAVQAQAQNIFGTVNVVIDAQRSEFYLASWELSDAARKEILPLRIVTKEEVVNRQAAGEIFVGPEMDRLIHPSAAVIAQLVTSGLNFTTGAELAPIYLRETTFVKAGGVGKI